MTHHLSSSVFHSMASLTWNASKELCVKRNNDDFIMLFPGVHWSPRHRAHVHHPRPEAAAPAVRARPHLPRRHRRRRPAVQHAARAGAAAHGAICHQHVSIVNTPHAS